MKVGLQLLLQGSEGCVALDAVIAGACGGVGVVLPLVMNTYSAEYC